ncbi:MAG: flagellar hook assembly protein FlgD [Acetobacteraceae bacterium]|nr:flagellar hook assembly protein FlgD [Acetobacteraceae bacterium]
MALAAPNATTAATTTAATASSGSALTALSGNYETFLSLLMTQLKNQDPTNPLDTNEFTSQLVQFASVEQQIATNRSLGQLIDLTQSGQVVQSSAMVGRQVEVTSDKLSLQDGQATVKFTSPTDGPVAIAVYGANGAKLADGLVQASTGPNQWNWNGRNGQGTLMRDGAYTVAVASSNADGSARALPFTVVGTATGVEQKDSAVRLQVGGLTVDFKAVKSVAPAAAK